MDYKLSIVRVFVTDWNRAVRFYTETLGMQSAFRSDEMGVTWTEQNSSWLSQMRPFYFSE